MAGSTCRYRSDWYLDGLTLAQSGQGFNFLADRPSQSNGPSADCAISRHVDQIQLSDALYCLTWDDQNLLFVERNQNSPEHAAIHTLRAWSCDLYLECPAAGFCFRNDFADCA